MRSAADGVARPARFGAVVGGGAADAALRRGGPAGTRARRAAHSAWRNASGLLVLRGGGGADGAPPLSAYDLVRLSAAFGAVELNPGVRDEFLLGGKREVQVLGTGDGALLNACSERQRVGAEGWQHALTWHTDQLFRAPQPRGSALACVAPPPVAPQAATAFISTELDGALEAAPQALVESSLEVLARAGLVAAARGAVGDARSALREALCGLDVHCSYSHHNAVAGHPPLTEEQRAAHPPLTLAAARDYGDGAGLYLNCLSSAVMAALPRGESLTPAQVVAYEVSGEKHASARALYDCVLPLLAQPSRVYAHEWKLGDVVVWDNLRSAHAPTWFDASSHTRTMWRTTFA